MITKKNQDCSEGLAYISQVTGHTVSSGNAYIVGHMATLQTHTQTHVYHCVTRTY